MKVSYNKKVYEVNTVQDFINMVQESGMEMKTALRISKEVSEFLNEDVESKVFEFFSKDLTI